MKTALDIPNLHEFFRLCLSAHWDSDGLARAQSVAAQLDLDWETLAPIMRAENLTMALYPLVRDRNLLPAAVEAGLRNTYYNIAAHNIRFFAEVRQVVSQLHAAGVAVILLKGAALAYTLYPDPSAVRPMVDVDVLIPAQQTPRAHQVLTARGYAHLAAEPWPGFYRRYRNSRAYRRNSGGEAPYVVGLHWHLLDIPHYERIPMPQWFADAQPLGPAGPPASVPAVEDHLVYMSAHLALHHQNDPALFRYYDLAALIHHAGEELDWEGVISRAKTWHFVCALQQVGAQIELLWPGTVPPEVGQKLADLKPTVSDRWIYSQTAARRTPASDALLYWLTLPGVIRRLRYLLETAFPSPTYMRTRYQPHPPYTWPLTYLRRFSNLIKG